MMKSAFILASFFISAVSLGGNDVKFQTNRIHGFFNFIEALEHNPYRARQFYEKFDQSLFNTADNRQLIAEMKPIFESIWNTGYRFSGYPDLRRHGPNIQDLFVRQSANSKSLADFKERTQGLLPIAQQKRLFEIFKTFEPIYGELIWNPALKKSEARVVKLNVMAGKINLAQLFQKAAHFYNSGWPLDQSFIVSLNPIPGAKGQTSSEADGDLLTLGFLIDGRDFEGEMGVVVHEMAHSLYHAQSLEFQNTLDSYFKNSKAKYANDAYELLNEGLATAVGNGWAQSQFDLKSVDHQWYTDVRIEAFARGLYPLVKKYIEATKAIDAHFIEAAIAVYADRVAKLTKL